MRCHLLPDPTLLELRLARRLSGSSVRHERWKRFASGEWYVRVEASGKRAWIIGRNHPPGEHLLQTLLLADTLREAGARDIRLVLPYFAYARQDRKMRPGDPLSGALMTKLFRAAGVRRMATLDLHSQRIVRETATPIDDLPSTRVMATALRNAARGAALTIVSPDGGGRIRAERLGRQLGRPSAWIEKHRGEGGRVAALRLHGTVRSDVAIVADDMIDGGSTAEEAAKLLREAGAKRVWLAVTHGVCSPGVLTRLRRANFERIFIGDTLPLPKGLLKRRGTTVVPMLDAFRGLR